MMVSSALYGGFICFHFHLRVVSTALKDGITVILRIVTKKM
jgi:hypothetical protein